MQRLILGIAALAWATSASGAATLETSAGPVSVVAVVQELDTPWAVAFLPGGTLLITERDGRLLHVDPESGARAAVSGVPEVFASGQGGLLDVVLDPAFETNSTIYLSYSEPEGFLSARTAVMRAVIDIGGKTLANQEVIFRQAPATRGGRHFGSRIVPDGNGHLFITTGDRGASDYAQAMDNQIGKLVRIRTDGTAPADNPFPSNPLVWSLGHRNAQGAAIDGAGQLWTVSHGARGGDEINRPEPGKNYGWPVISYGTHYSGGSIGEGTSKAGLEQPVWYWDPSIAPSGMAIYSGALWPEWAGDIFVGSLKFDYVSRLNRDGTEIDGEERLFPDRFGRIRDVREGPGGALWFLSVGDGVLYRMTPAR